MAIDSGIILTHWRWFVKVGDLFIYKKNFSIYKDLDGLVGVVLSKPNRHGQYRTQVGYRTLYLLEKHMEKLQGWDSK